MGVPQIRRGEFSVITATALWWNATVLFTALAFIPAIKAARSHRIWHPSSAFITGFWFGGLIFWAVGCATIAIWGVS